MSHKVDTVGKFKIGINQFIWGQTLQFLLELVHMQTFLSTDELKRN